MDEIDDVDITPLNFLEAVYCNPNLPLAVRMRAAIGAAPYRHSKRSVTAIVDGNKSFAEALERAIERGKPTLPQPEPKLIEAQPAPPELPASELKRPMAHYRNNFRRY
jgi:hypothetical protein